MLNLVLQGDNMTNTAILKQKIDQSGYKLGHIASVCDVSTRTLYNKIMGKTPFVQNEILVLMRILELSEKDMADIFFASNVEAHSTKVG